MGNPPRLPQTTVASTSRRLHWSQSRCLWKLFCSWWWWPSPCTQPPPHPLSASRPSARRRTTWTSRLLDSREPSSAPSQELPRPSSALLVDSLAPSSVLPRVSSRPRSRSPADLLELRPASPRDSLGPSWVLPEASSDLWAEYSGVSCDLLPGSSAPSWAL